MPPTVVEKNWEILWRPTLTMATLHIGAVYGAYLFLFKAMWMTCAFAFFLYCCSILGITAGAHRLWSHKSYKARLPLRILLLVFNTIAFQYSALYWARNHRIHHKYSDTDADPHNANRGFFFSHFGWVFLKEHPAFIAQKHAVDISDLLADPLLRFQKKYYTVLMPLLCYIMPMYIPTVWGESPWIAFFVAGVFRHIRCLNMIFLINSAAHLWGNKPYDKNIKPVETKPIALLTLGETFHNYHHAFPWDYKAAELGNYSLNLTKLFIDFMAKIGWAYDLKTASTNLIQKRVVKAGDGSHEVWGKNIQEMLTNGKMHSSAMDADETN